MSFEFLSDSGADCRYGDDEGIRFNNFGCLHQRLMGGIKKGVRRVAIVGRGRWPSSLIHRETSTQLPLQPNTSAQCMTSSESAAGSVSIRRR